MRGRVLLVHFHYPPDGMVGAQVTTKFAKYLPDVGWDAWVLTAAERYYTRLDPSTLADVRRADRVLRTACLPHPRYAYLAAKRRLLGRRPTPSRRTDAFATTPARRPALVRAVRDVFTTPDDVTGWIPPAIAAGRKMIRAHGIERLYSSGPPWTNHLVACALARLSGLPWVACFEDPWSETRRMDGRAPLALGLEQRLEAMVVARADAVVCLNDHHRRAMAARFPCDPSKFVTISNGFDADDFPPPVAPPRAPFTIAMTGTIYPRHTPRHFFAAVRRVLDTTEIRPWDVSVVFAGECAMANGERVDRLVEDFGLRQVVRIHPFVPRQDAIALMQASHVLLALAHDYVLQIPSKTYQYLRVGRPILALAPEGATADLIRTSGAGVVVDPFDVDGIARAIGSYLDRVRRGERLESAAPNFIARFERRALTRRLADLLENLPGTRRTEGLPPLARAAGM